MSPAPGWASGQKGPSVQQKGHCAHTFRAERARGASICPSLCSVKWVCCPPLALMGGSPAWSQATHASATRYLCVLSVLMAEMGEHGYLPRGIAAQKHQQAPGLAVQPAPVSGPSPPS